MLAVVNMVAGLVGAFLFFGTSDQSLQFVGIIFATIATVNGVRGLFK